MHCATANCINDFYFLLFTFDYSGIENVYHRPFTTLRCYKCILLRNTKEIVGASLTLSRLYSNLVFNFEISKTDNLSAGKTSNICCNYRLSAFPGRDVGKGLGIR